MKTSAKQLVPNSGGRYLSLLPRSVHFVNGESEPVSLGLPTGVNDLGGVHCRDSASGYGSRSGLGGRGAGAGQYRWVVRVLAPGVGCRLRYR